MKKQKHHFIIGLFVLSGLTLLVLAGILFGGGELFQEKIYFETYFDSSVQGLEKGSAVQLRGVTVGEVESISFASADYSDDLETATEEERMALRYIRVVCSINTGKYPNFSEESLLDLKEKTGLITTLKMQGITGGMLISLDFEQSPTEAKTLPFTWTPEETYIPSRPTTLENIISVAEKIATNLENIDFSETVDAITALTTRLSSAIDEMQVEQLSKDISDCAQSIDSLVKHLDAVLIAAGPEIVGGDIKTITGSLASVSKNLETEVPQLTQNANATLTSTTATIDSLNETIAQLKPLVQAWSTNEATQTLPTDIDDSLQQLSQTLRSLEALIDTLRERPSRLLFDDAE